MENFASIPRLRGTFSGRQGRKLNRACYVISLLQYIGVSVVVDPAHSTIISKDMLVIFNEFVIPKMCVFQCQPTALLHASGSAQGG